MTEVHPNCEQTVLNTYKMDLDFDLTKDSVDF